MPSACKALCTSQTLERSANLACYTEGNPAGAQPSARCRDSYKSDHLHSIFALLCHVDASDFQSSFSSTRDCVTLLHLSTSFHGLPVDPAASSKASGMCSKGSFRHTWRLNLCKILKPSGTVMQWAYLSLVIDLAWQAT